MESARQNNGEVSYILCGKCKSKMLYQDYVPGTGEAGLACIICGNREGSRYGFIYPHKLNYDIKHHLSALQRMHVTA